jgi:hypothetical protein
MFDPIVAQRAGRKSFENFEYLWNQLSPDSKKRMQETVSKSEHQYHWLLKNCRNAEPTALLDNLIATMMQSQVDKCAKLSAAAFSSEIPPSAWGFMLAYNHICEVTFAYAPAIVVSYNTSHDLRLPSDMTDRMCYHIIKRIQTSTQERQSEFNTEFVRGLLSILSSFLAMLELDFKEETGNLP